MGALAIGLGVVVSNYRAQVITVSTRAASGVRADTSGAVLVQALTDIGFDCAPAIVIPDGPEVAEAITGAVDAGFDVVITTGGTGLTPKDNTPEYTQPLFDREIPGIADSIRAYGVAQGIPTAVLSRGVSGQRGRSLIINAPGSPGGAKDAIAVIAPIIVHALDQINGGDH